MTSLKRFLFQELIRTGYLSISEIENICRNGEQFYKLETAERKLRQLKRESGIVPIKDERGILRGYKYIPPPPLKKEIISNAMQLKLV